MMKWKAVTFYTKNTPYQQEVNYLKISAASFGIDLIVKEVSNLGSWELNCGQKSTIIREALEENTRFNILYVDADAIFCSYPKLFDTLTADIAYYLRGTELLSGTLFFKNCPEVRQLVRDWEEAQFDSPTVWDQKSYNKL